MNMVSVDEVGSTVSGSVYSELSMENIMADSRPFGMAELAQVSTVKIHADAIDCFSWLVLNRPADCRAASMRDMSFSCSAGRV